MTLQIPPDFAEISMVFTCIGDQDPWNVTFGAKLADGLTADASLLRVGEAWKEFIRPGMSDRVSMREVHARVGIAGEDPLQVVQLVPAPFDGTDGGGYLPQNCALLVDKFTNKGGRKNRGRFFWPLLLKESEVDNVGNIEPLTRSALNVAFASFLTALEEPSAGDEGQVLMYILHNSALAPTKVEKLSCQPVISTQRRRLR